MCNASEMGFLKAAALSPEVTVANPEKNGMSALAAVREAAGSGAQVAVLPELHLSGYTCADLFGQDRLIRRCEEALEELLAKTAELSMVIAVGLPVRAFDTLYNCAAVIPVSYTHLDVYKRQAFGVLYPQRRTYGKRNERGRWRF